MNSWEKLSLDEEEILVLLHNEWACSFKIFLELLLACKSALDLNCFSQIQKCIELKMIQECQTTHSLFNFNEKRKMIHWI